MNSVTIDVTVQSSVNKCIIHAGFIPGNIKEDLSTQRAGLWAGRRRTYLILRS